MVILRPPIVFGPGVKANFLRLLRLVDKGAPLPIKSIRNARSMIYVGNLADAVASCAVSPAAAGRTFLVADPEPRSTPELVRFMAAHLGRPARLLPMPIKWLRRLGGVIGKGPEIDRLVSSLVVEPTTIMEAVGWNPPYRFDEAMKATVRWYRTTPQ